MRKNLRAINVPTVVLSIVASIFLSGGVANADRIIHNRDIARETIQLSRLSPQIQSLLITGQAPGKAGTNGTNGKNGATGAIGATGPIGPTGPTGP